MPNMSSYRSATTQSRLSPRAYSAMLMKKWRTTGWTEAPTPDGIQYFFERADRGKNSPQYSTSSAC